MKELMEFKNDIVNEEKETKKGEISTSKLQELKLILPPFNSSSKTPSNIYNSDTLIELKEHINTQVLKENLNLIEKKESRFL